MQMAIHTGWLGVLNSLRNAEFFAKTGSPMMAEFVERGGPFNEPGRTALCWAALQNLRIKQHVEMLDISHFTKVLAVPTRDRRAGHERGGATRPGQLHCALIPEPCRRCEYSIFCDSPSPPVAQTHDTLFTPTEAAVLTGLPLKAVNNAIDRETVAAVPGEQGGRLLDARALVSLFIEQRLSERLTTPERKSRLLTNQFYDRRGG
jgi:hypothetical protein